MLSRSCQFGWRRLIGWLWPVAGIVAVSFCLRLQADPPSTNQAAISPDLMGRTVEEVRVTGNQHVSSEVILNVVKTHEHDKFDPASVEEDYQHIYALKRFSNVEARIEPTATGVVIIFDVTEEKLIKSILFVGNRSVDNDDMRKLVDDLQVGQAIDTFRINLARRTIINSLRSKNHPFAHVTVNMDEVLRSGDLIFTIVEGPPVTIRSIGFIGNHSFDDGRLNDQVKTTRWWWIFNSGTYDMDEVDQDVAILRHYYQGKGFFDVKVGRKLIYSPDQTEMEVDFLIEEGMRYKVGKVEFTGNKNIPGASLSKEMNLKTGDFFDEEVLQRDIKQVVKAYSPLGYIYDPHSTDKHYLRIGNPNYPFGILTIPHMQPGLVDLVYEISEGRPMRMGRIIIKGNERTQDKVVNRELRVQPGQLYNSFEIEDATDRLRGLPMFERVNITPIGTDPDTRDVLIEVSERKTADITAGLSVNSNLGLVGNFGITQKNFDITNFPSRIDDFWDGTHPFTGAGQTFHVNFSPGVYATSADVGFTEPFIFDLPYYTTDRAYYTTIQREAWDEQRAGGSISFGKQFWNYQFSTAITMGAEDVKIGQVQDYYPPQQRVDIIDPITHEPALDPINGAVETQRRSPRALEILQHQGHNTQTNAGISFVYDTTNHGPLVYKGLNTSFSFKEFGALGAEYHFSEFDYSFSSHHTLYTDLLDRKTVLNLHLESGYITPDAPFFDRYYGGGNGGQGAIRGFQFRGASPRSGRYGDPVGGDFELAGSAEINFPLYGEGLRGVIFTDVGTVEPDIRIHTIRQSVGAGVRVVIPFLGPTPLAFDVGFPVLKGPQDETQIFSFGVDIKR